MDFDPKYFFSFAETLLENDDLSNGDEENGRKLDVHHVAYDKDSCCELKRFNCAPNLFIPVTKNWNVKMNGNREYWEENLTNYIMIWHNGECYLPKEEN
jgi:hypothetical protein